MSVGQRSSSPSVRQGTTGTAKLCFAGEELWAASKLMSEHSYFEAMVIDSPNPPHTECCESRPFDLVLAGTVVPGFARKK
jgi:hypothetical protein